MFSSNSSQVSNDAVFVEDVFSTYLYTGNGSTQTITNGIDLAGKGGLVWMKTRSAAYSHFLADTARGVNEWLRSNTTDASANANDSIPAFNSNGFTVGTYPNTNDTGVTFASWTFRKQPKFFDVVTWTGDSTAGRTVAHNLGSVPGCIIVKCTSQAVGGGWPVYHRSLGNTQTAVLNTTDAAFTYGYWNNTTPTSTVFTLNGDSDVNGTGKTYVAYLFAHNAGGFGLTGTDNVISCGSFTSDIAGVDVNLGYEPQWVMLKVTNGVGLGWYIWDSMRGFVASTSGGKTLEANSSSSESDTNWISPTATGFKLNAGQIGSGNPFIYIAIRRGPMKVPTSGTSVFSPNATTSSTGTAITTNFPVDLYVWQNRDGTYSNVWQDRLRGIPNTDTLGITSTSQSTLAEQSGGYNGAYQPWNTGLRINSGASGSNSIYWNFRRAPSFMDVVCWAGNGSGVTVYHNLTVAPELVILKSRNAAANWVVRPPGSGSFYLNLNNTNAVASGAGNFINNPTATTFSTGDDASVNTNGVNYFAYLFATCAGVSKVGTYTGTGSTLTIDCGFAGGARFVMIKRSSNSGNWFVWDTARGMVSGTDPRLALNTTSSESNSNWVYTVTGGFQLVEFDNINISGQTYIFLAIA